VFPRVVSDREVRPSDLADANLVLFGTRETNSIIAQLADRLPLHLTGAPDRFGLAYVYPVNGRYVLVNSGLPWWQAGTGSGRNPFTSDVAAFALAAFGDYVLFEGSTDNVIAGGRFDSAWHLPAADAERMTATGAVAIAPFGTSDAASRQQ